MQLHRPSLVLLALLLTSCSGEPPLISLKDTHVHGLAVDRGDSTRLHLATHHGLLVLENDTTLIRVGRSRDDFMGFSPHPTDSNILFSSGHPKGGGNLGVQKSEDGGASWKKIANGYAKGPADFHAMIVHAANSNHLYGWYKMRIHRSEDGGTTWRELGAKPPEILTFEGDPRDPDTLYIGTVAGLLVSRDRGETWTSVTPDLEDDVVFDIEIDPGNPETMFLATRDHGIMRSSPSLSGGLTWETMSNLPKGDTPEYLALDPKAPPNILYVFSEAHALYKSGDGGKNWQKVL